MTKSSWFKIIAWGIFSLLPIVSARVSGLGFLFPGIIFSFIFGAYAGNDEDIGEGYRWLWALSFFFTLNATIPLFWLFRILIPFLEQRQKVESVKTNSVWSLLVSLVPTLALFFFALLSYLFPAFSRSIFWGTLGVVLSTVIYFSYHLLRYSKTLKYVALRLLSFILASPISLPWYWFKHIYKPTLFPANVQIEAHELWDDDDNEVQERGVIKYMPKVEERNQSQTEEEWVFDESDFEESASFFEETEKGVRFLSATKKSYSKHKRQVVFHPSDDET